jgi:hypothetical protein
MHGLNSRIVKQRVLRRHYGIATSVAWNNERHPLEARWDVESRCNEMVCDEGIRAFHVSY